LTLEGFSRPFSPGGAASIVQAFPWDFSMEALIVHFRADEQALDELIPDPLGRHPERHGEAFWLCVDHVTQPRVAGSEQWHPSRLRSFECAIGVPVSFGDRPGSYWPYSWTDSDWNAFSFWTFGYAARIARLSLTHTQAEHPHMRGPAPGAVYRASVERLGDRVADATVRLAEEVAPEDSPLANLPESFSMRHVPDVVIGSRRPLVHDLIVGRSEGRIAGPIWRGAAELSLNVGAENEWLAPLEPLELIAGYHAVFGYSIIGAETVFDYTSA
jgi:acetoacetate decarboxylase